MTERRFRLLMVDTWPPAPDRDAASLQVTRVARILERCGAEITFGSGAPKEWQVGYEFVSIGTRPQLVGREAIIQELEDCGHAYEVIWLIRADIPVVPLDEIIRLAPSARLVYDTQDLKFLRGFRAAKATQNAMLLRDSLLAKRALSNLVETCDATTVVSESERQVVLAEHPDAMVVRVPLVFEPCPTAGSYEGRSGLAFIGNFSHQPNGDALRYAYSEIVPRLRSVDPTLQIGIIGSYLPDWFDEIADPHTVVHGHVPDLAAVLSRYRLTFAPLRFGAGVNGKVLNSLAHGVPAVVSELAAEGIARDGDGLLVADSPDDYVSCIIRVHNDAALWGRLRARGLEVVASSNSAAVVETIVDRLLDDLAVVRGAPRGRDEFVEDDRTERDDPEDTSST
jgi:glycosyltransferase involved in cell wall biosynthesis